MTGATDGPPSDPADRIAQLLELVPLEHEGGRYRQMLHDGAGTAIYFLLGSDDASAWHRLPTTEVWHHYAGASVRLGALHPDGTAVEHRLGDDVFAGERPQVVIPGGVWQGAVSTGAYSLLGTTMAPPYSDAGFELGQPPQLRAAYPGLVELIEVIADRSRGLWAVEEGPSGR